MALKSTSLWKTPRVFSNLQERAPHYLFLALSTLSLGILPVLLMEGLWVHWTLLLLVVSMVPTLYLSGLSFFVPTTIIAPSTLWRIN